MMFKVIGIFFVGLAMVGVVLPILPTTPFLLVAVACFAKSSPRLHQRLLNNPIFGPLIKDWQTSRSIPKNGKIIALISMFFAGLWSCYLLENMAYKIVVVVLMLGPAIFIWRLPITSSNN